MDSGEAGLVQWLRAHRKHGGDAEGQRHMGTVGAGPHPGPLPPAPWTGPWLPPDESATLLRLAPELGAAETGQGLPELQERVLNGSPGG